ncbi:hypothetical protein [Brevundimonas sp.]|jgi:hypothetical protein|uniref:hypothetical protein n=1 Tax=Brevundimonas sp. TaxID=1871086 RepID=UPI003783299D
MKNLEDLSIIQKMQIVTTAINYMSGNLQDAANVVESHTVDRLERAKLLESTLTQLCRVAEDLGNMLNDIEFMADIDEKITEVAFEIVNEVL